MLEFQKQEKNKRTPRNSKTPSWHAHAYNSGEWNPRPYLNVEVEVQQSPCDGATISYIYTHTSLHVKRL
jgi:hypothetical protein